MRHTAWLATILAVGCVASGEARQLASDAMVAMGDAMVDAGRAMDDGAQAQDDEWREVTCTAYLSKSFDDAGVAVGASTYWYAEVPYTGEDPTEVDAVMCDREDFSEQPSQAAFVGKRCDDSGCGGPEPAAAKCAVQSGAEIVDGHVRLWCGSRSETVIGGKVSASGSRWRSAKVRIRH